MTLKLSHDRPPASLEPIILLTATVNPDGMSFTARSDPKIRLKDYESACSRLLRERWVGRVLFCENTGADLDVIVRIADQDKRRRLKVHSFQGNSYPRDWGKGFGELNIVREALTILPERALIVKITGRYYVRNLRRIVHAIMRASKKRGPADIICNLNDQWNVIDSRVFAATPEFFRSFVLPHQDKINDAEGVHFETIMTQAMQTAIDCGRKWSPLPYYPIVEGISATIDQPYPLPPPLPVRAVWKALEILRIRKK